MTVQQLYANMAQADNAMRPLVTVEVIKIERETGLLHLRLRNDGLGPAFGMSCRFDEASFPEKRLKARSLSIPTDHLGTEKETLLAIAERTLVLQNLVVEYTSAMNSRFETRFKFPTDVGSEYMQTVRLIEQPYAELASTVFKSYFTPST
jgi:hypothetical protein